MNICVSTIFKTSFIFVILDDHLMYVGVIIYLKLDSNQNVKLFYYNIQLKKKKVFALRLC